MPLHIKKTFLTSKTACETDTYTILGKSSMIFTLQSESCGFGTILDADYCICSDPKTKGQGYFVPSVYSKYNLKYETLSEIQQLRPYIDSCTLGDYSQNVPKPKRTQVKTYHSGVKIYPSELKMYLSGVKTYPKMYL